MSVNDNPKAVNPVLKAALAYAAAGIPVFPCEPSTKEPVGTLVPPDRDPRGGRGYARGTGGFKKATRDPVLLREWWTMRPDAMAGIPTGAVSGIFVIDLDVPKQVKRGLLGELTPDGVEGWRKAGVECKTYEVETGSGGRHIYFRYDPKQPVTNKEGALKGLGINVRGDGGYEVVPPSRNCNGGQYRPANGLAMADAAEAPDALYKLLGAKRTGVQRKPREALAADPPPDNTGSKFDGLDSRPLFHRTPENIELVHGALNALPADDRQNEWFPVLCALNTLSPEWGNAARMIAEWWSKSLLNSIKPDLTRLGKAWTPASPAAFLSRACSISHAAAAGPIRGAACRPAGGNHCRPASTWRISSHSCPCTRIFSCRQGRHGRRKVSTLAFHGCHTSIERANRKLCRRPCGSTRIAQSNR